MTDTSPHFAYLFEAKGIQRYILDSGPLRDLVGASDLVASLASSDCNDLLAGAMVAAGLGDGSVSWSRRAGGAFMLHAAARQPLERFRTLWRLVAQIACPGLEMSDALSSEEQAAAAPTEAAAAKIIYRKGESARFNTAAALPPTGHPSTAFNPRTGRLAVALHPYKEGVVASDVLTVTQRRRAEQLADGGAADAVAARFLPEGASADGYVFPRNLDAPGEDDGDGGCLFPFRKRRSGEHDRRIAVIHADLSGLGETFRRITAGAESAQELFEKSRRVEQVVVGAARAATERWLMTAPDLGGYDGATVLPARPIVLGGDDITLIVRADLALPFARTLLESIEALGRDLGVDGLSACAGIAVVRAGQPFLLASALAEDLCRFAKERAKRRLKEGPYPSAIAFHNAQSTLEERYRDILARELVTPLNATLTANPYALGELRPAEDPDPFAELDVLEELIGALAGAPRGRGKLIDAARLLFEDEAAANEAWRRWGEVLQTTDAGAHKRVAQALARAHVGQEWRRLAGLVSDALDWLDFGFVPQVPSQERAA